MQVDPNPHCELLVHGSHAPLTQNWPLQSASDAHPPELHAPASQTVSPDCEYGAASHCESLEHGSQLPLRQTSPMSIVAQSAVVVQLGA